MKKWTWAACLALLPTLLFAQTKEFGSVSEMLTALESSTKEPGIQVGVVIDPYAADKLKKVFAAEITIHGTPATAFDTLQKANVEQTYSYLGGDLKNPSGAFVESLQGYKGEKTDQGPSNWAFFTLSKDKQWVTSNKGVGVAQLKDGDVIGFSRTPWSQSGTSYKPKSLPRITTK